MEQDRQQRRVKNTDGSATHRTGKLRGAIKPHKTTAAPATPGVKQTIGEYLGALRPGSLTQTIWGTDLSRRASVIRANFGLPSSDEPYLLLDANGAGDGKAGMLLCTSGIHLNDGRGNRVSMGWDELATTTVSYQRGMLVIGQSGVVSRDGQVLADLLLRIKAKGAR